MKKFILFIVVSIAALTVSAQDSTGRRNSEKRDRKAEKRQRINALSKQEEEGTLVFRKQNAFGIQLRTNGYGVFYELGKRRSPRFTNLYMVEITEIKNRKEEKLDAVENFFSNSFIYGKMNNFYQLKLAYGQQYILGQKGNKNGVAVTASLLGGLSAGFLKPYYLNIEDANGQERTISYYEDSAAFANPQRIFGAGGLGKGWNEVKLKPGAFAKGALRFDFGRYNERLQALEIGLSVDYYAQDIPILLYNDPMRFFFQGHIAFVFGNRK
ncbi:MAG TPA: hypothetical protein VFR58_15400 [Flavisolibacter sp.]|nr:hypothetical protein [Flavisolibacter sp.]